MKRILLTIACLLAFAMSAFATEERVLTLPQDQGAWYLTVFGDADDAKFQELQTWLASSTKLAKLKSQTRFNAYTTDQLRYRQRYAKDMPGLPCIRLQNERGIVVSEFWGDNIPMTATTLFVGIQGDLKSKTSWGCLRRKRCPKPKPPAPPAPPVNPPVEPPVGPPDIVGPEPEPEPEPEAPGFPWLFIGLAALIGGSVGFAQEFKKEHMNKE